jgi:PEP-CTERM motif
MKSRKTIELSESFNKRWLGYAAAAGATGIGLMAAAQARADIVYPGNPVVVNSVCGIFPCQLLEVEGPQGGGDVQFTSYFHVITPVSAFAVDASVGSQGVGLLSQRLPRGARIGPGEFLGRGARLAYVNYSSVGEPSSRTIRTFHSGPWFNNKTGYFGFEFKGLDGQVHFGWALLYVSVSPEGDVVNVEGVAYNSVPDQQILAGQTTATPEPGTLGLLALGSLGLGYWRRRTAVSSQQ